MGIIKSTAIGIASLGVAASAALGIYEWVSSETLDHGIVEGKELIPGYMYMQQVCTGGKTTTCVPIPTWIPECHQLQLRDGEDTGSTCVTEQEFSSALPGARYSPHGEQAS